ncbi:hypothetical protein [Fulvivirga sedimenti]|uniref:Uncharacterized protein n=1 Tax=Fulvivirga sedimenti TaxID=2879465 RepID=A0A9X1HKW9_9BACT|nr:hypothetical protein [Fulvivirga sedimenti]MCA6073776.1 hypothetical protein [Fulvivirga sedimenti]
MKATGLKMDIHKEKLRLIEWLAGLNDTAVIKEFIALKESRQMDWWDETDETTRKSIKKGLSELNKNEGISHDQVMQEIRQKYNL